MVRMLTLLSVVGLSSAVPLAEFMKKEELSREVTTLAYSNGCSDKLADVGKGRRRVWHDADGSFFNCYIYAKYGLCTGYSNYGAWPQYKPMTARIACCTCGGGEYISTSTPSGSPGMATSVPVPLTPTDVPSTVPQPSTVPVYPTIPPTYSPPVPPTNSPPVLPTNSPPVYPTIPPTYSPPVLPTNSPPVYPTIPPTFSPPVPPTNSPPVYPTIPPTYSPPVYATIPPTYSPGAILPSSVPLTPTNVPLPPPTLKPTCLPTVAPTALPTLIPTAIPTFAPK